MKQVKLGIQGLCVPAIGLGYMGMPDFYGASWQPRNLRVLERVAEIGCTFRDTADMYGPCSNQILLSKALAGRRQRITLATKFGVGRGASIASRKTGRRRIPACAANTCNVSTP